MVLGAAAFLAFISALPAGVNLASPLEQKIEVAGFADFIAVDGSTVWITNKDRVERWSRKGLIATVPLPGTCGAMAIDRGSLWVADCKRGRVNRIDTRRARLVASIETGIANPEGELNVAVGAGAIWVASDATGKVTRIDPRRNRVAAVIPVDPGSWYLAFGHRALWAVSAARQTLQRIDPRSNKVTGRTQLGREPGFLAVGAGAVWVQEQGDGTVARIDPQTGALVGRVKVGAQLKWGDIDVGDDKVWLRTTEDQVFVAIDPRTMSVLARIGPAAGSGGLRHAPGGIWTTAHDAHTLSWWPNHALRRVIAANATSTRRSLR